MQTQKIYIQSYTHYSFAIIFAIVPQQIKIYVAPTCQPMQSSWNQVLY